MNIVKVKPNTAPIILLYGGEGRGKTTLASKAPNPIGFLLERGLPIGVEMDAISELPAFESVMEALRELYKDPRGYESVIFDTVDSFEPLLIDHVCRSHGWRSIETPSYGKGYIEADNAWRRFLHALKAIRDKHNVAIILVAHSTVETVNDPRAPSYTAYAPKLHKRARGLVMDACDGVFFLDNDLRVVTDGNDRVRAEDGKTRILHAEGGAAFAAKNRWRMPPKMPVTADTRFTELSKYWSPRVEGAVQ